MGDLSVIERTVLAVLLRPARRGAPRRHVRCELPGPDLAGAALRQPVASRRQQRFWFGRSRGRTHPGSNVAPSSSARVARQERLRAKGVGPRYSNTPRSGTIRYIAVVGGRVQVPSKKVGEAPRDGVVTGLTGSLLRVRWSTGEESTVVPSMGSLAVVGKTRLQSGGDDRRRQTTRAQQW